jgi:pyrimidine-specific ribonucleoside hydrolase
MPDATAQRAARLAFWVPLGGSVLVFFLGAGSSLSNLDIRDEVQTWGLAALAALAAAGLFFSIVALRLGQRRALAGLALSLFLVCIVAGNAILIFRLDQRQSPVDLLHPFEELRAGAEPVAVWIDTDAACGRGRTADVDDCWALAAALRSPEIAIRGVSTTFGNVDGPAALEVTREVLQLLGNGHPPPVFRGADVRLEKIEKPPPAIDAMAAALRTEPLVVIALGPATNVAALLRSHPSVAPRIRRLVLVAGRRPGNLFHPGEQWWLHFRDFNVSQDKAAASEVLYSGVPITLVPFELATGLVITGADLDGLRREPGPGRWLAQVSAPWYRLWRDRLHRKGFSPFDVLAVGYVSSPRLFDCRITRARIGFSAFLAPFGLGRDLEIGDSFAGPPVEYCVDVQSRFKERLLNRLTG